MGLGLLGALLLAVPGCGGPVETETQGTVETQQTEAQPPTQEPCAPAPDEPPPPPASGQPGTCHDIGAACSRSSCCPGLGCVNLEMTPCLEGNSGCTCVVLLP